jgi:flagellar basal-body rod modification protein FlgD
MNLIDLMALQSRQSLTPAEATQGAGDTEETSKKGTLGRDDFLKMLLAQLENQDPLDPQDATEFTAQLATFSMLEQLVSIQEGIGRIEDLLEDAQIQPSSVAKQAAAPR